MISGPLSLPHMTTMWCHFGLRHLDEYLPNFNMHTITWECFKIQILVQEEIAPETLHFFQAPGGAMLLMETTHWTAHIHSFCSLPPQTHQNRVLKNNFFDYNGSNERGGLVCFHSRHIFHFIRGRLLHQRSDVNLWNSGAGGGLSWAQGTSFSNHLKSWSLSISRGPTYAEQCPGRRPVLETYICVAEAHAKGR